MVQAIQAPCAGVFMRHCKRGTLTTASFFFALSSLKREPFQRNAVLSNL